MDRCSLCFLTSVDHQRLQRLIMDLYDCASKYHSASHSATMEGFSVAMAELPEIKDGNRESLKNYVCAFLERSQQWRSQQWETVMIEFDYLEQLIEHQSKLRDFLEAADNKKPPASMKIVWKVAGRMLALQAEQLGSLHTAIKDFTTLDLKKVYASGQVNLGDLAHELRIIEAEDAAFLDHWDRLPNLQDHLYARQQKLDDWRASIKSCSANLNEPLEAAKRVSNRMVEFSLGLEPRGLDRAD